MAQSIPFIFRGQSRFYRVFGIQGDVAYGLGVEILKSGKVPGQMDMVLAFGSIGTPPADSPFERREETKYLVAFEEEPTPGTKPVVMEGWRLNKIVMPIGKNLDSFGAVKHLESQIPALRQWLEKLMESAGIMPAFNEVEDVFAFFFGKHSKDFEVYDVKLPDLVGPTDDELGNAPAFDFSKYKQGTLPAPKNEETGNADE